MPFDVVADVVVVVHVAFLVFVGGGALLVRRVPRLARLHLAAIAWGLASILIGLECPLTDLEKWLRRRAGADPYRGGFVDHYLEGVLYPEWLTPVLWGGAALLIVVGYAGHLRRGSE